MDKEQEAMQERLGQYSAGDWEEINSIVAEYNSLCDEGEMSFSKAVKGIIKELRKIAS